MADFRDQRPDVDPQETADWLESLRALAEEKGSGRASYVLRQVLAEAQRLQIGLPPMVSTHYVNTIAPEDEQAFPGDEEMENRIRRLIRWNAAVMVLRANITSPGIGGHLSTYASAASLYEVGFNHFFHGKDHAGGGDQIFYQGHATPGIYARSFLEYRLDEGRLDNFRREALGKEGLSSYPHPRLMPDYWEFPTVSMGLGPINAVYQARFNRYLQARGFKDTSKQRVWCFTGDGEMDEPESIAGLTLATRERLDNLIFVINCNLQRLDGPVRGNGKIIQELESLFRGAGWHVIKVVWGREWDPLLARDTDGVLVDKMDSTVDGEFQRYSVADGAYIREHFFGPDPRLKKLVEHLPDSDLPRLRRGGHDYRKIYTAYKTATELQGAPVVILAKTIKGWALGESIEARNVTHQAKKMSDTDLRAFRDRLGLPISDAQLESSDQPPYYRPPEHTSIIEYLQWRREELGGLLPERRVSYTAPSLPKKDAYEEFLAGTEDKKLEASTTQAFVRILRVLLRDKEVGRRIVPIIPDEARTFGMESLFKQVGIYAPFGQSYEPVDVETLMPYTEMEDGQILEEGITEAGSMAAFTAAGTSYATHGELTIPFFIFYSMFGFQRVGDLIWAFGDVRGRGFLCGATAGRTTLEGEGLQHNDGHSPLVATTVPNALVYDPAFAYELAIVIREGLRRMYEEGEDIFYYLTLYNEAYVQPKMPRGVQEGILRGLYRFKGSRSRNGPRAQLLASGPMMRIALEAQQALKEHGVAADVWSATSYQQLRADALECEKWNRMHPTEPPKTPFVSELLDETEGPIVAVSDYMQSVPDQIARWVRGPFVSLGTDGFGRSDHRTDLRRHFDVDAPAVVAATLHALSQSGEIKPEVAADNLP
jgi:pyruvate dehydrogenase E1 component